MNTDLRLTDVIAILIMRDELKDAVLGCRTLAGSGIVTEFDPADVCGEILMLSDYLEKFFGN
jgi:hypothetical protein